jgi:Rad3-related DNA helicase
MQTSGMREEERESFLNNFGDNSDGDYDGDSDGGEKRKRVFVGFCVLGGVFSEGIDLTGDRLNGAVIVGVGLPRLSAERDIIKKYFDEKNGMGYEYSYMYPGMNKILQAAGRVIRTETDKGVVLLLDERFNYSYYKKLFPAHWNHFKIVRTPQQLKNIIDRI